jgi:hypothetical protein
MKRVMTIFCTMLFSCGWFVCAAEAQTLRKVKLTMPVRGALDDAGVYRAIEEFFCR